MNILNKVKGLFNRDDYDYEDDDWDDEEYEDGNAPEDDPSCDDARITADPVKQLRYAYHPNVWVLYALARNRNLKLTSVFIRFLNYPDTHVRMFAIQNINLPTDLLLQHLSRLDPLNNEDDHDDFVATVEREEMLIKGGFQPEPEIVELFSSHGYSI